RQLAFVEIPRPGVGEKAQGFCELLLGQAYLGARRPRRRWRPTIEQIGCATGGITTEIRRRAGDALGCEPVDQQALLGEPDGRLDQGVPRELGETLVRSAHS